MIVLGIESSCDECSASVVRDGRAIASNVVATQVDVHRPYSGVVPEIASRIHTEWIAPVVSEALRSAGLDVGDIEGIAVTNRPGLVGSLIVGLSYAKALAFGLSIPWIAINHIDAHLYAPHLEIDIAYPHLGVIVSGGHTMIARVEDVFTMEVLGTTIDDACGEAFDKIAKFYSFGFPGGKALDELARRGDGRAFRFPVPLLNKGDHRYDVSYSGLKTAAIHQLDQFLVPGFEATRENIAASFERASVEILLTRIRLAVEDTGIRTVVFGGGVVANTFLRRSVAGENYSAYLPDLSLCTDNAAMVAGLGYHYLASGRRSGYEENAYSRVEGFRNTYP